MTDLIQYEFAGLPALLGDAWFQRTLDRSVGYCHLRVRRDLDRHAAGPAEPLRVLIAGGIGLIGDELTTFLQSGGHEVVRLVRLPPASRAEIAWDPAAGLLDVTALEGFDAVIHLADAYLGADRGTRARRRRIHDSRVRSTKLLCAALAGLRRPPGVLVAVSTVGYYGDVVGTVDETVPPGPGFLAEVTAASEQAAKPARAGQRSGAASGHEPRIWARAGRRAAPPGGCAGPRLRHSCPVSGDGRTAQGPGRGPGAPHRVGLPLVGADPARCAVLGARHPLG